MRGRARIDLKGQAVINNLKSWRSELERRTGKPVPLNKAVSLAFEEPWFQLLDQNLEYNKRRKEYRIRV